MEIWNHIYSYFDPVMVDIFGIKVHWYGVMYVTALLIGYFFAKWLINKDRLKITHEQLDAYFIWAEIGVILGARLGFIFFYSNEQFYYLTHPWNIFNPFNSIREFVGIRGMSYHGAVIGFVLATYLFVRKHKVDFFYLMDLVVVAIPIGYIFGRIGNFLNKELVGRVTDVPWKIYVDGVARHPSQLYEAFLEGLVIFVVLYMYRTKKRFDGELLCLYGMMYGSARFCVEYFREADVQIGYLVGGLSLGQILSLPMIVVSVCMYIYLYKKVKKNV